MKKTLLIILGFTIIFSQSMSVQASNTVLGSRVKAAIRKYNSGNYTGCLQDCQNIVKYHPNGLAYYYMAMSYTKAGKKDLAVKYYGYVIGMARTPKLKDFAIRGKRCIETPDKCNPPPAAPVAVQEDELDKFINGSNINVSDSVKQDYQQKRLNTIRNQINNGKDLNDSDFIDVKDYSKHRTYKNLSNKIAQAYTDEDIQNVLNVLNESGYNSGAQDQTLSPEVMQIKAVLDANKVSDVNPQNINTTEDMLPYLMSEKKNELKNYTPQMLQSIILNSTMMNEFNYKLNGN